MSDHGHSHAHSHSHGPGQSCSHDHGQPVATTPPPRDMIHAAMNGDLALCKQLIEHEGASVNAEDADGNTAVHWAVYRRHNDVARYLIQKGCNLDVGNKAEDQTPLHWAAISGNVQAILLLLNSGATPGKTDARGYNALHHAVQYNEILAAHLMLTRGVAIDTNDKEGHTALHWAAYQGHEGLVRYLIKRGSEINPQDSGGCTPLHWAAVKGHLIVARVLVDEGADVKVKDRDGATAEQLAFQKKHFGLANALRDAARFSIVANANEKNKWIWFGVTMIGIPYMFLLFVNLPLLFAIMGLVASVYALKWGCGKTWPSKDSSNPAFVGVFVTSYILSTLLYFTRIIYVTGSSVGSTALFIVGNFIFAITYLMVLHSDPGFIRATKDLNQVIEAIDDDMPNPQICPTCLIQKPIRSKHCRACGKCIAKMDHHCHWINNCVGSNNHVLFMLVLVEVILLHNAFAYYCFAYLAALPGAPGLTPITTALPFYFRAEPLVVVLMLFHVVNSFWESFVLWGQLRGIGVNVTTNESMNAYRYSYLKDPAGNFFNPFDHGWLNNWKEFLFNPRRIDWLTVYTLPSRGRPAMTV